LLPVILSLVQWFEHILIMTSRGRGSGPVSQPPSTDFSVFAQQLVSSQNSLAIALSELADRFGRLESRFPPAPVGLGDNAAPVSSSSSSEPTSPSSSAPTLPSGVTQSSPAAPSSGITASSSSSSIAHQPPSPADSVDSDSDSGDLVVYTRQLAITALAGLEPFYDPLSPPDDTTARANTWFPKFLRVNLRHFIIHQPPVEEVIPLWLPTVSRFVSVIASYRLPASWSSLEKAEDRIDAVASNLIRSLTANILDFLTRGSDIRPFHSYVAIALSSLRADCPWIVHKDNPRDRQFKLVIDTHPASPDKPADGTNASPAASTPPTYRLVDAGSRRRGRYKRK
jgi:hypothetical protein